MDLDQAKLEYELGQLAQALEQGTAMPCQVLPAGAEIPIPTLAIQLEPDYRRRDRIATVMFVPLPSDQVESLKLLQLYCELPLYLDQRKEEVLAYLAWLNLQLPLGAFAIDPESQLVFKYVYALGKFKTIEPEEFIEAFLLWMFSMDSVFQSIEELAEGTKDLQTLIDSFFDE